MVREVGAPLVYEHTPCCSHHTRVKLHLSPRPMVREVGAPLVYEHTPCCSGFGELALLYSAPRAATVRTAADCRLWVMERAVYNAIKHTSAMQLAAEKCAMVAAVPMLSVLSQVGLFSPQQPPPLAVCMLYTAMTNHQGSCC